MKLFANTCEFEYPWDQVTAANWKKYPNEISTHVVAVDVLRREMVDGKLTTERLITCEQGIPKWLQCIVGAKSTSYVREVSTVDLATKTLTLRSINLTMSNLLKVYEIVTYTPHKSDPNKTVFTQEAQITAYASFNRVCSKIEEWSVQRFGENAKKGKAGFESVLKLLDEKWEQKDKLVDEFQQELTESLDKVVKTVDESLDKVVKTVDESLDLVKTEIVKEADKLLEEADKLLEEAGHVKKSLVQEAEMVKKSILSEYYDMIKKAFKRE